MNTPDFDIHRAIVHSSNPVTGEAKVRIPALLGASQVVSIPTTGLTNSDGLWNVPSAGSSVFIAVSVDRVHFLWLTAIGVSDSGGNDPSNEPIGHEDRTASYIAFDNGTRTFSIQPANTSYVVWCVGLRYEKTSLESIQIPDTTGLYYISFDAQGQLQYSTDYFVWDQDCPTAYVYWNSTTQRAEFFADERHGITMDWQTHEYLHRTRGAAYANGFDASNFDISTQDGDTDAQAKLDIDNGTFFDEDLQVDVRHSLAPTQNTWEQQLQGPARIPVFYRFGLEGWHFDDPTDFPVKKDVFNTHPTYNGTIITAGGAFWDAVELDPNSYGIQWIVATNQLNYPVLSVMGQTQYANVGQAEAASWADMELDGLPIVEIRVLYKIIFRATGTNTPGCYFEQIDDYRNALSNATSTAAAVVDHGNLTGLADDDHPQYLTVGRGDARYTSTDSFQWRGVLTIPTANDTTAELKSYLLGADVFDSYVSAFKTSWNYDGNADLTDAGGLTELAGTSWLTWTDNSTDNTQGNITALVIAPNTGTSAGGVFIYNDQGSSYSPGWREVWTSATDGSGSGLDADTVDGLQASSFLRSDANDTATGLITFSGGIDGFTLDHGISGSNFNITGVNQLTINDEGEGISFPNVTLYQEIGDTDRLRLTGNLLVLDDAGPHITIRDSNTANSSGYISFEDNSGTRLGYIGYPNTDDIHIQNEATSGYINVYAGGQRLLYFTPGRQLLWGEGSQQRSAWASRYRPIGTNYRIVSGWDNSASSINVGQTWLNIGSGSLSDTIIDTTPTTVYRFGDETSYVVYAIWGFTGYTNTAGRKRSRLKLNSFTTDYYTSEQYFYFNQTSVHQQFVFFDSITFDQTVQPSSAVIEVYSDAGLFQRDTNDTWWLWVFNS